MRHDFKSLIQTAVGFDVDFLVGIVNQIKQFLGIFIVVTTVIYFQLYAEKPLAFAIKDGGGLYPYSRMCLRRFSKQVSQKS